MPDSDVEREPGPRHPQRLSNFATYFKNYMGLSSVFIAALPVPVTQLGLIPVVPEDKGIISTLTSVVCFLLVAFIFSLRHSIGMSLFPRSLGGMRRFYTGRVAFSLLTLALIFLTVLLFFEYHKGVTWYLDSAASDMPSYPLSHLFGLVRPPAGIEYRTTLVVLYAGFFASASSAFVLMAIREYLQDVLSLDDRKIIYAKLRISASASLSTDE